MTTFFLERTIPPLNVNHCHFCWQLWQDSHVNRLTLEIRLFFVHQIHDSLLVVLVVCCLSIVEILKSLSWFCGRWFLPPGCWNKNMWSMCWHAFFVNNSRGVFLITCLHLQSHRWVVLYLKTFTDLSDFCQHAILLGGDDFSDQGQYAWSASFVQTWWFGYHSGYIFVYMHTYNVYSTYITFLPSFVLINHTSILKSYF